MKDYFYNMHNNLAAFASNTEAAASVRTRNKMDSVIMAESIFSVIAVVGLVLITSP